MRYIPIVNQIIRRNFNTKTSSIKNIVKRSIEKENTLYKLDEIGDILNREKYTLSNFAQNGSTKKPYKIIEIKKQKETKGYTVLIDNKAIYTKAGICLIQPTYQLALLVCMEQEMQGEYIHWHTMPVQKLCISALERVPNQREEMEKHMLECAAFDSQCIRGIDDTGKLNQAYKEHADTIQEWFEKKYKCKVNTSNNLQLEQSDKTLKIIKNEIKSIINPWEFAILESMSFLSKSIILSLAFINDNIGFDRAYKASTIEEIQQVEEYGIIDGIYGNKLSIEYYKVQVAALQAALDAWRQHTK